MARVISVFLPMWPVDRLRRQAGETAPSPEAPLVLARRVGNRRLVTAACGMARALGLSIGMPVSKAQALVPDLQVMPYDPAADAAALEQLAPWVLQRISPIVSVDPPDGLVIDSTGADHLHGGEDAMPTSRRTAWAFLARSAIHSVRPGSFTRRSKPFRPVSVSRSCR